MLASKAGRTRSRGETEGLTDQQKGPTSCLQRHKNNPSPQRHDKGKLTEQHAFGSCRCVVRLTGGESDSFAHCKFFRRPIGSVHLPGEKCEKNRCFTGYHFPCSTLYSKVFKRALSVPRSGETIFGVRECFLP